MYIRILFTKTYIDSTSLEFIDSHGAVFSIFPLTTWFCGDGDTIVPYTVAFSFAVVYSTYHLQSRRLDRNIQINICFKFHSL